MSSFLDHIAMRSVQTPAVMRPRRRSMFEPDPGLTGGAFLPLVQADEPMVRPDQVPSAGPAYAAGSKIDTGTSDHTPGTANIADSHSLPVSVVSGAPVTTTATPAATPFAATQPMPLSAPATVQRRGATGHVADGTVPQVTRLDISLPSVDASSGQTPAKQGPAAKLSDQALPPKSPSEFADRPAPRKVSFRPIEPMEPQPARSAPPALSQAPRVPGSIDRPPPQAPVAATQTTSASPRQQTLEPQLPVPTRTAQPTPVAATTALQGAFSVALPQPRDIDPGPGPATIEVHIGRVEFVSPMPPPVHPVPAELPGPSLDSFLSGRRG